MNGWVTSKDFPSWLNRMTVAAGIVGFAVGYLVHLSVTEMDPNWKLKHALRQQAEIMQLFQKAQGKNCF